MEIFSMINTIVLNTCNQLHIHAQHSRLVTLHFIAKEMMLMAIFKDRPTTT